MSFQNEKCNDIEKVIKALNDGAKIVNDTKSGYAIEYPSGGYFRITQTIYNKLNK